MAPSSEPGLTARGTRYRQPRQARFGNANAALHGGYSKRTPAQMALGKERYALLQAHPQLQAAPASLVTAYLSCTSVLDRLLVYSLEPGRLVSDSGDPSKLASMIRRYSAELRALAGVLGLSADGASGAPSAAAQIQRLQGGQS